MSRVYTCKSCNLPKTTTSTRGPLPQRCPTCNPKIENGPRLPPRPKSNRISIRGNDIASQIKVAEAIRMRMEYRTWNEIAETLGWADRSGAINAVRREMERRRAAMDDQLDELRAREFDRLEALGKAALEILNKDHMFVSGGRIVVFGPEGEEKPLTDDGPKLAAINTLIKVSESLRKLLGLDTATKVDAAVTVQFTVKGIPEEEMP